MHLTAVSLIAQGGVQTPPPAWYPIAYITAGIVIAVIGYFIKRFVQDTDKKHAGLKEGLHEVRGETRERIREVQNDLTQEIDENTRAVNENSENLKALRKDLNNDFVRRHEIRQIREDVQALHAKLDNRFDKLSEQITSTLASFQQPPSAQ